MRVILMTTAAALLAVSTAAADDGRRAGASAEVTPSARASQAATAPAWPRESPTSVAVDDEASVLGGAEVVAPRLASQLGAGMSRLPAPATTARGAMIGAVGVAAAPPPSSNRHPAISGF